MYTYTSYVYARVIYIYIYMMCLSCALRCDYGAGWRARKGGHSATNGRDHNTHTHTHTSNKKKQLLKQNITNKTA